MVKFGFMKRVAVYCGSSTGNDPIFAEHAKWLGQLMVMKGLGLVYGGAQIGIMGTIANSVMKEGGTVHGVIPDFLDKVEITHHGLTELHVTRNMPERKKLMFELSDGFIALPGGNGTLEELFEVFTWAQLSIHHKPIGILNTNGYYDHLIAHINYSIEQGFLKSNHIELLVIDSEPEQLLEKMLSKEVEFATDNP